MTAGRHIALQQNCNPAGVYKIIALLYSRPQGPSRVEGPGLFQTMNRVCMTPVPRHALVFHIGGVEFVIRPAGVLLFGSIAAALDVAFLPLALPDRPAPTYHLAALLMGLAMIATTLLHESGHAIACRAQGIWPVRITLRGSGGACAVMVHEDSPRRALIRAMAGPAMTALVVMVLVAAWHTRALPPLARLIAATLAVFSTFDLIFNTLPVVSGCDGTFALRALLWWARRRPPDNFAVLYLWRPPILAAATLALVQAGTAVHVLPAGPMLTPAAAYVALALCAIPPAALGWRYVAVTARRTASGQHAASH